MKTGAITVCFFLVFTFLGHAASLVPLKGAYNVRDLGGYATESGNHVKTGVFYRSGDLNKLTQDDLARLSEQNIQTIVDFRSKSEREKAPHKVPSSVKQVVELEISLGNVGDYENAVKENGGKMMEDMNRQLVRDYQTQYKEFFKVLADNANTPLLFNCSAGKDRTGLAAALLLSALGVDRETIILDYLLSADNVKEKYAGYVAEKPWLAPLFTVDRRYIEAAFDEIDKHYGGMEKYLTTNLGVDTARMKRQYTE